MNSASVTIIARIAQELELTRRDHNHMLIAAGYAPLEQHLDFHDPELRWLRHSMVQSMRALDPFPATLIDEHSTILMVNRGFVSIFNRVVGAEKLAKIENNFDFIFGRDGSENMVVDWENTLSAILMASQQAALFYNNPEELAKFEKLTQHPSVPKDWKQRAAKLQPISSFPVEVELPTGRQVFFNSSMTVGSTGPAAFVSEPRLTLNVLYPEDSDLDLQPLMDDEAKHPLLFY